ncbi:MAG: 2-oxo acid dehydrogenase subunit E2 [Chloroflexaceae bacterium]|nr:2-oxo acid dehydrogenase subunit E2 [Chloroflexaceae bacterium]
MPELNMPRLSDTMEEGTIGRWLKQAGDQVEKGEILVEIETDKATMELESYDNGVLQKILVQEGETVAIGTPIAIVGDGAVEAAPADTAPPRAAPNDGPASGTQASAAVAVPSPTATASAQTQAQPTNGHTDMGGERVKASPVARNLAAQYGIDLRQVQGTGPGGRIIKENVEQFRQQGGAAAAPAQPAAKTAPVPNPVPDAAQTPGAAPAAPAAPAPSAQAPAGATVAPMNRMRQAISRAMSASKAGIPHIYVTTEIDMAAVMELRKQINESGASPVKISVNDMIIKAAAKAIRVHPIFNNAYTTGEDGKPAVLQRDQINISVAVAIDEGLVAPVVRDADKKALSAISAEVKEMAGRAREGKIRPDEIDGGTFTVSNLGMLDVVEFAAIISVGQTGALAVGNVRQTPVVRNGEITIGQMMYATVSADHRLADGATAAQFLQELKRLLESPMALLV